MLGNLKKKIVGNDLVDKRKIRPTSPEDDLDRILDKVIPQNRERDPIEKKKIKENIQKQ